MDDEDEERFDDDNKAGDIGVVNDVMEDVEVISDRGDWACAELIGMDDSVKSVENGLNAQDSDDEVDDEDDADAADGSYFGNAFHGIEDIEDAFDDEGE